MVVGGPEKVQDPALEAAARQYDRSRSGESFLREHRGKIGLAVGLAVGLFFTPHIQCAIVEPWPRISPAPESPETRARIRGILACQLDEDGTPVCVPLTPEIFEELEDFSHESVSEKPSVEL